MQHYFRDEIYKVVHTFGMLNIYSFFLSTDVENRPSSRSSRRAPSTGPTPPPKPSPKSTSSSAPSSKKSSKPAEPPGGVQLASVKPKIIVPSNSSAPTPPRIMVKTSTPAKVSPKVLVNGEVRIFSFDVCVLLWDKEYYIIYLFQARILSPSSFASSEYLWQKWRGCPRSCCSVNIRSFVC